MMLLKHPQAGLFKLLNIMTLQEFKQHDVDTLIDDAEYLLDEAEALKYVIDSVPYDEIPPDDLSIYDKLRLIDHTQNNYYRPVLERVFSENRLIKLSEFNHFRDTFESKADQDEIDVQKVLSKIIKHRAALLTIIKKFSKIDWERLLRNRENREINLFQFASSMIENERKLLKEIADLVLIYQNEQMHQREINKRSIRKDT